MIKALAQSATKFPAGMKEQAKWMFKLIDVKNLLMSTSGAKTVVTQNPAIHPIDGLLDFE